MNDLDMDQTHSFESRWTGECAALKPHWSKIVCSHGQFRLNLTHDFDSFESKSWSSRHWTLAFSGHSHGGTMW